MVIGLLAIAAIPTVIGVGQAVSAQKKQDAAAKEQAKFRLTAVLPDGQEAYCVLVDDKLYLDHPDHPVPGHRFNGYFFTYPSEAQQRGIVSTISDDPPMLNWIYVDRDALSIKYGKRSDTLGHIVGPWYWSADEEYLVLQGTARLFVAVEEDDGRWAVYYDPEGTSLAKKQAEGDARRMVRVALRRKMHMGMQSKYI